MAYQQPFNFNEYVQYVNHQMNNYKKEIETLKASVKNLTTKMEQISEQKPTSIQYKFDQLKIEKLEGTLNIGLRPDGSAQSIEDFNVEDQGLTVPSDYSTTPPEEGMEQSQEINYLINEIHGYLEHYFMEDVFNDLQILENKYNYVMDNSYRQFIINDVKRQIPTRINYYIKYFSQQTKNPDEIIQLVINKIREDIYQGLEMFIQHLPQNRSDQS